MEETSLECYELLTMQYLDQSADDEVWQRLHGWNRGRASTVEAIVSLPKELWFIGVMLKERPQRLRDFLAKFSRFSLLSDMEDLLVT